MTNHDRSQMDLIARLGSQIVVGEAKTHASSTRCHGETEEACRYVALVPALHKALDYLEPLFPSVGRNVMVRAVLEATAALAASDDSFRFAYPGREFEAFPCTRVVIGSTDECLHSLNAEIALAVFGGLMRPQILDDYVTAVLWHGLRQEHASFVFGELNYGMTSNPPRHPWMLGQPFDQKLERLGVYLSSADQLIELFLRYSVMRITPEQRQRMSDRLQARFDEDPDKRWYVYLTHPGASPEQVNAVVADLCGYTARYDGKEPGWDSPYYRHHVESTTGSTMRRPDAERLATALQKAGASVVISDMFDYGCKLYNVSLIHVANGEQAVFMREVRKFLQCDRVTAERIVNRMVAGKQGPALMMALVTDLALPLQVKYDKVHFRVELAGSAIHKGHRSDVARRYRGSHSIGL